MNVEELRVGLEDLGGPARGATPAGIEQVHRVARGQRRGRLAIAASLALVLLSVGVTLVLRHDSADPRVVSPADVPVTTTSSPPTADAQQQLENADFVPVSDRHGQLVGYTKNYRNPPPPPATEAKDTGPKGGFPVFQNPDGTGPIVGYVAAFGFVTKAQYDAPDFNIDAERAAFYAETQGEDH